MAGKQPTTKKSLKLQLTLRRSRLNTKLLSRSNLPVQSPYRTWRILRGHLSGVTLRPQVTPGRLSVPLPLGTEVRWGEQRKGRALCHVSCGSRRALVSSFHYALPQVRTRTASCKCTCKPGQATLGHQHLTVSSWSKRTNL